MLKGLRFWLAYLAIWCGTLMTPGSVQAQFGCPSEDCGEPCWILQSCGLVLVDLWPVQQWGTACGPGIWLCMYGQCLTVGLGIFDLCNVECMETLGFYWYCVNRIDV